ncbi:MAG: lysophospholipid acyltransferase family protein [Desulfonatronovibrio sp.]
MIHDKEDSRLTPPTERFVPDSFRRRLYTLVMNAVVYPLLIFQTLIFILFAPVVLPLARLFSPFSMGYLVRYFIWIYGRVWMALMSLFVRFERIGLTRENFPAPSIIVVNHLSFFDIFCMGALPEFNIAFTVRAWPFRMFWYAPFMRLAGYVNMESLDMEEALAQCRRRLENGVSLVFFPEGHRSRNGKLTRFYSGAFKLAIESGTPVVPVCITGTDQLLPRASFCMAPATVRLKALSVFKPEQYAGESAHVELRKQVKASMAGAIENMRGKPVSQSTSSPK